MTGHARAVAVALALGLTLAGAGGPALAWSGEAPAGGAAGLAGASDRAGAAWTLVDDKEKGGKKAKDDRKEAKAEHAPPRPASQPAARVEPAAPPVEPPRPAESAPAVHSAPSAAHSAAESAPAVSSAPTAAPPTPPPSTPTPDPNERVAVDSSAPTALPAGDDWSSAGRTDGRSPADELRGRLDAAALTPRQADALAAALGPDLTGDRLRAMRVSDLVELARARGLRRADLEAALPDPGPAASPTATSGLARLDGAAAPGSGGLFGRLAVWLGWLASFWRR